MTADHNDTLSDTEKLAMLVNLIGRIELATVWLGLPGKAPQVALTMQERDVIVAALRANRAVTAPGEEIAKQANFETTPAQRARIRELAQRPDMDDYDRSVIELLDDFARSLVSIAVLSDRKSPANHDGPLTRENCLPRLRQAIIDNTRGEEMFWLGEILLAELEKETGFNGQTQSSGQPTEAGG